MVPETLIEAVRTLLDKAGSSGTRLDLEPLAIGGNNRVFSVESESGRCVAKWYYHDLPGGRDRMQAEFDFLSHIRSFGVRNVPRPIACDPHAHIAIYEFVPGRRAGPSDLTPGLIDEAARLFATINAGPVRGAAAHLPSASDACFSIADHVRSVDRRIERLSAIRTESPIDKDALQFVYQLDSAWQGVRQGLLSAAAEVKDGLPDGWRCLSPSDFGFHNAIVRDGGEMCFLDFEYAGWDDPAKMIGDFFSHPGLPVPGEHMERFTRLSLEPFDAQAELVERVHSLMAVSRVRWCCIMLNEFLPDVADRRRFADPAADMTARKHRQLEKSRCLFAAADI